MPTRRRSAWRRRTRKSRVRRIGLPVAIPMALGLTLGIVIAVSSGNHPTDIKQTSTGTSASASPSPGAPTSAP
jgi:hypothetical protein